MSMPRFAAVLGLFLLAPLGARAADLDPYLPADTESYVAINVRQLLDSPIIKKNALPSLRELIKGNDEINDALKDLGLDPFKDVERIIIASPNSTETDRGLIIAHGTFDAKKVQAHALALSNKEVLTIHKVPLGGGVKHDVYEIAVPGQGQPVFVTLANNKVVLASPGKDYIVDALKQVKLNKRLALKNKEFQAILEKIDAKQSLSLAMLGKSLAGVNNLEILPKQVRDAVANIEVIGGGLTVSNEIKLDLAVSTKNEGNARVVREVLGKGVKLGIAGLALLGDENKTLDLLLEVLKTVRVTGKGKVVSVSGTLTADVLGDFFKNGND